MFLKVQGVAVIEKRVDILLRVVVAIDDIANRDARGPHYFVGFSLRSSKGSTSLLMRRDLARERMVPHQSGRKRHAWK